MHMTKVIWLTGLLTLSTASWSTLPTLNDDSSEPPTPRWVAQLLSTDTIRLSPKSGDEQFWGISNHHLEQLFATSNDLICIMDRGQNFVRLNKQWEITLGYHPDELMSQAYINFVHPKDVAKTLEHERQAVTTGLVNRYRRKSGSYRWLDWIGLPNASRSHNSNHQFAIARDVTLNKLYEKNIGKKVRLLALEDSQTKTALLEAVAEVQTSQLADLLDSTTADDNKRTLKVALRNFIHLSHSQLGFIGEVFYSADAQPYFQQMWSAHQDARQSQQDDCADNNQTCLPNAVFEDFMRQVVQDQQPLFINDFQAFQQHNPVATPYQNITSFVGIPLLSQGELMGVVGLSQQPLVGVLGLANRAQAYTPELLEWLKPLTVLTGRLTGEAKSERIRKDLMAEQQKRYQVEEANRLKSLFIAHMSHEIRTPLMGIMGHLELVDKRLITAETQEHLNNAQMSAKSLLHIANDVLDISKIQAGTFQLDIKPFDFTVVAQEILDIVNVEADRKNLKMTLMIDPQLPATLLGDAARLRQILLNLIGNAVKFTPRGTIDIHFTGQLVPPSSTCFRLQGKIKDSGIGMAPDTLKQLFQPFHQADQSIYRQLGGTGLGLYITKQLCNLMQGDVSVDSQQGQGSTFNFQVNLQLPLAEYKAAALASSAIDLPSLNILVVEDNLMTQRILKITLERLKCQVGIANNGQEAVDMIKAKAVQNAGYDIVLMDGEMPVMDGLEATRQIRRDARFKQLPIIGVTAHTMLDHKQLFLAAGMNGYLSKPVTQRELVAEIKQHLNSELLQQIYINKRKLGHLGVSASF